MRVFNNKKNFLAIKSEHEQVFSMVIWASINANTNAHTNRDTHRHTHVGK